MWGRGVVGTEAAILNDDGEGGEVDLHPDVQEWTFAPYKKDYLTSMESKCFI